MVDETMDDSLRLAATNTGMGIAKGTIVSEKPLPQGTNIPLIEICNKLLLCNNFDDALTYLPFFIFRCCESVVLYTILLEMARKLSRFCKMGVAKSSWPTLE